MYSKTTRSDHAPGKHGKAKDLHEPEAFKSNELSTNESVVPTFILFTRFRFSGTKTNDAGRGAEVWFVVGAWLLVAAFVLAAVVVTLHLKENSR
jgi:hypothetical protein